MDFTGFSGLAVHSWIIVSGGVILTVSVTVLLTFGELSAVTLGGQCLDCVLRPHGQHTAEAFGVVTEQDGANAD